jgi:hypothetical protein
LKNPLVPILKSLLRTTGFRVNAGPFKGVRCVPTESGDAVIAKVCGTYEMEIYPAIEELIARNPRIVADIGAAEGFYVAGFAHRLPAARIIAYEARPEWQDRIRNLLRLNRLGDSVEIRGYCGSEEFRQVAKEVTSAGRGLVFMDIEGGEGPLLLGEDFRDWQNTDFLVELHEPDTREPGEELARKMEATHHVSMIEARERSLDCVRSRLWRLLLAMPGGWITRLNEGRRYQMRWLVAKSRRSDESPLKASPR